MIGLARPFRQALALILLLILLGLLWVLIAVPVMTVLQDRAVKLKTASELLSRYRWLAQHGPDIDAALESWTEDPTAQLIYNGLSSNQASVQLQNDVVAIIAASGLNITRSRLLPVEEGSDFSRLGLNVELIGDMNRFGVFLNRLQSFPRMLRFDNVVIRSADGRRLEDQSPPRLHIQLDVYAFSFYSRGDES